MMSLLLKISASRVRQDLVKSVPSAGPDQNAAVSNYMSGSALLIHEDCRHFRGDIPCKPNKEFGVHCDGCEYYDPIAENILIIKLGAAGDVLRTTPILHRLKIDNPQARIWWLTLSPELVPLSNVDKILKWSA